jgi:AcrR family transcriptional regulator
MAKRRNDMDKQAFIEAAEKLILDKGANDFSLADLAAKMGISKGTLYYHYPSKDDLILDIIEEHMGQLSVDYVSWLSRHKNDCITEERFLDVVLYKGVKLFNRSKMHIYLLNECMRGNESLRGRYVELWDSWEKKLQEGLSEVFKDEPDKEAYAYTLMLIIDGMAVQEALGHSNDSMTERMKKILISKGGAQ